MEVYRSSTMTMSSSGGGGGTMLGGGGLHGGSTGAGFSSSSVSMSSGGAGFGGVGVGGGSGSVAFARKTNTARSSVAASGNSMIMALSALGGGNATYAGTHGELGANPKAVIQRRDREKHDINDLNVKLAEYIEQNGWYRIKVKEQEKLILKMKTEFEAIEVRLRGIYDVEMANLRATIDATAREKAAVELKVDTLETLYKDFRAKYEAELSAHESTRLRLPKLEREISEKDAQIDFLAKTLSSLEPQVSALKAQISTYQKESIEAKMGADAEIVARVELESKLVTKQDEIDFIKRIYEEKLKMALDFDFDSDATYSNDLAEALKDIRAEYQAQLEAISGGADETWFQQKFDMMMTTSKKQGAELTMARDEVTAIKSKYNELMTRVSTFDAQILALKTTISQREADLVNEKKMSAVALADRDAQIAEFKRQIAAHILELKGLMDAKLSLDEEIAVYRRLLLAGGSATTVVGGGSTTTKSVIGGGATLISGGSSTLVSGGSSTVVTGGSSAYSSSSSSSVVTSSGFGATVSDAERGYYAGVFSAYDRSGDGRIDGSELLSMFNEFDNRPFAGRAKRNATTRYCSSLMSTADSDGSGKLDFEEFLRLMIFEKKIFLKNAFKAADVGGKGYLTESEVINGLAAAGYEVNTAAKALVTGARGGADGRISYNEFVMNL